MRGGAGLRGLQYPRGGRGTLGTTLGLKTRRGCGEGEEGGAGARESFTAVGWPIMEPRLHEVEAGINRVYGWHKANRLFIFDDMVQYLDELMSYSRKLDENYQPTMEIRDKSRYHLLDCFVAGTMVRTLDGEMPIERLSPGALVATRRGYYPVLLCEETGKRREVVTARFSDGTELRVTPEHPFWVEGRGFVPLDKLRYHDIMLTWDKRPLCSKASPTISTRTQSGGRTESTSQGKGNGSTAQSGKMLMGRFQRAKLFITRTTIRLITAWRTWSWSGAQSMPAIITSRGGELGIWPISGESGLLPLLGTVPQKESHGISNTGERWRPAVCQWWPSANLAARPTKPFTPLLGAFAPITVRALGEGTVGLTMSNVSAPVVGNRSPSTAMRERKRVPGSAVRFLGATPCVTAPVYNLKVAEVPEYYANGILVHNCARYLLGDFAPEMVQTGLGNPVHRFDSVPEGESSWGGRLAYPPGPKWVGGKVEEGSIHSFRP